ncbi:hypothetical protein LINPERHAP2_LOCUS38518 [Linum perenne]
MRFVKPLIHGWLSSGGEKWLTNVTFTGEVGQSSASVKRRVVWASKISKLSTKCYLLNKAGEF